MKRFKKFLALGLSLCMVMGSSVMAFAEGEGEMTDGSTGSSAEVDAPIYSYNVTKVVVPTDLELAFNPDGHTVKVGDGSETSTDQIVSINYGVMNLSSKDKTMKVAVTVTDNNTTADGTLIEFVETAAEIDDATADDYMVYLAATPVDIDGGVTFTHESTATDLAGFAGTPAGTGSVAIVGSGAIGFNLQASEYEQTGDLVTGKEDDGEALDNDASTAFTISGIQDDSVQAFTLTGAMNTACDWTEVTQGVTVGVTYTFTDCEEESPEYGVTALTAAPTFTSTEPLKIAYTTGMGDDALYDITSVTAVADGKTWDIYAAQGAAWTAATDDGSTITFSDKILGAWASDTLEVTINYSYGADGANSTSKTATLKLRATE